MPQHLIRRGNTWIVRVAVPRPLQKLVGRKEVQRTTGTTDLRLAERRKHEIIADIRDQIDEAADRDPSSSAWLRRQALAIRRSAQKGELDAQLAGDLISDLQDRHLKALGTSKEDPDLPESDVRRLQSASRIAIDLEYRPLSDLIETYLAERKPVVVASTYGTKRRILDEFTEWLQDDPDVNEVNRKLTGSYVTEVLVGNGKSAKTNADTITALSSFFNWMIHRGDYDHANPWTGLSNTLPKSKRGAKKDEVRRWTDKELQKLFCTIPAGPKHFLREMSAIALYTGMRAAEIAELEISNVDLEERTIEIPEGKTVSAPRVIPIHSKLWPVINELVENTDSTYLFPTFKPSGVDQSRAHEFSKRFGYWRNSAFPETVHIQANGRRKAEVNFHSFRHAFTTACELAGIPVHTTQQIVGHSKSSLTYGHYSKGVSIEILRDAIEQVRFKGVNF